MSPPVTAELEEGHTEEHEHALYDDDKRRRYSEQAHFVLQTAIETLRKNYMAISHDPDNTLSLATHNDDPADLPPKAAASVRLVLFEGNGSGNENDQRVELRLCLRTPGKRKEEIVVCTLRTNDDAITPVPKHT